MVFYMAVRLKIVIALWEVHFERVSIFCQYGLAVVHGRVGLAGCLLGDWLFLQADFVGLG